MISVILPVYNQIAITKDCLDSIVKCEVKPDEIKIIDNGSTDDYYVLSLEYTWILPISIKRNEENLGVNAAWNQGFLLTRYPYITVLNNDTLLNPLFFKKILYVMRNIKDVGVCTPNGFGGNIYATEYIDEPPILEDEQFIAGSAFTIRREIVDTAGPIPSELRIFQGDAFLFSWATKLGYSIKRIINNRFFHYGSKTVKMDEKWFEVFSEESRLWTTIKGEIERKEI